MNQMSHSRRRFLQATASAVVGPMIAPTSILGGSRTAPSNRITMGVIGVGSMGMGNLQNLLRESDVQVVAVCDVHDRHYRDLKPGEGTPFGREPAQARVEKHYAETENVPSFKGCDTYNDFRELCTRDDIDAVVVATPDHWHAVCTLEALRNGKDVYCEKPVTHLFAEGQAICREVERRGAIVQIGSQQRSKTRFRVPVESVLNGHLGKIQMVEVGLPTGPSQPRTEPSEASDPPTGLDYDLWCGPSEKLPYIFARHHRFWRMHYAYGGGQIMDWIGHHNDIAHWSLGLDVSGPEEVEAVNWTFPETEIYNTPVNYEIRCRYAGGISISISNRHDPGIRWKGENGWMYVDRRAIDASKKEWILESFDRGPIKLYPSNNHLRNFLDCIRTRKDCIAPAEIGHRSITPGHLGLVSQMVGRSLHWNPQTETIMGDLEAEKLLKKVDYRKPWRLV
ncbi:MAG: dehydrogenase [Opitutaceae bacterium]|nr:dehydrogenase [Opitutaceae bacterium]